MNCFCFWSKPTVATVTEDDDSDATSTAAVTERGKVDSKGKNKKKEGSSSSSKPDQLALDIKKLKLDVGASSSGVREDSVSHSAVSFPYEELEDATQNFRPDWRLGEGGFGKVYMGYLERMKQDVAIKQLDPKGPQGVREFVTEVMTLINTNHPNLIKLFGYCAEKDRRLVVYELMPLGSLESHLLDLQPGSKPLDWNTRMKIAVGAARGLEYLHDKITPPIIYRDMKSSNILLGKGYDAKLSDFGLAKVGPTGDNTHVSTRVMGTYGYCAPEYAMTGQLTFKSDIYSFGVVLLEIITGKRAYDDSRPAGEQNLVSWARPLLSDRNNFSQMVDPLLKDQYPKQDLYRAIAIAALCVQAQSNLRPYIADVAAALEYITSQT